MSSRRVSRIGAITAAAVLAMVAPGRGGHDEGPSVPPGDEIEILDPHVDSRGLPRALLIPDDPKVPSRVEVPPTVIHHRYYYTGDRDFQGPMLPGGPSIVVVNHPKTGEQMMIRVQLMPGAPRIYYRDDKIEYVYKNATITLDFDDEDEPEVKVEEGRGLRRRIAAAAGGAGGRCRSWVERTGLPKAVGYVTHETVDTLDSSADRINDVTRTMTAPFKQVWESTPLGSLFTSSDEERATRARDAAVQRVSNVTEPLSETIPTVR